MWIYLKELELNKQKAFATELAFCPFPPGFLS